MEWITTFSQVGIGGVAIGALVLVVRWFLEELRRMRSEHERAMREREEAQRTVEGEIRGILTEIVNKANMALDNNTRVFGRVVNILDKH